MWKFKPKSDSSFHSLKTIKPYLLSKYIWSLINTHSFEPFWALGKSSLSSWRAVGLWLTHSVSYFLRADIWARASKPGQSHETALVVALNNHTIKIYRKLSLQNLSGIFLSRCSHPSFSQSPSRASKDSKFWSSGAALAETPSSL